MEFLLMVIVVSTVIALFIIFGIFLYDFVIKSKPIVVEREMDLEKTPDWIKKCEEWIEAYDSHITTIQIKSYDGLNLYARYVQAKESTNRVAILIHGYGADHNLMCPYAKFYLEKLGFNVLLPDLRGHGQSDGDYVGFGCHDRKDVLYWICEMIHRNGLESQIILHGVSMGAATVLNAAGEDLPENVKFVVSDCAYSSPEEILCYQMKQHFRLPRFPFINLTDLICKWKAGYCLKECEPLNQVKNAKVPILLIHGSKDKFVPTSMVYEIKRNVNSENNLLIIDGAEHGESFKVDEKTYGYAIKNFVYKYVH